MATRVEGGKERVSKVHGVDDGLICSLKKRRRGEVEKADGKRW